MVKQRKIVRHYTVWCADCSRSLRCEGETSREAAEFARARGWVSSTQEWYCPVCVEGISGRHGDRSNHSVPPPTE